MRNKTLLMCSVSSSAVVALQDEPWSLIGRLRETVLSLGLTGKLAYQVPRGVKEVAKALKAEVRLGKLAILQKDAVIELME